MMRCRFDTGADIEEEEMGGGGGFGGVDQADIMRSRDECRCGCVRRCDV